jgi:hypothetical protein
VGAALANGLAAATGALVQATSRLFGEARERGGAAYADFQARPEHARWRAYALGSYGLVVVATLLAQLYRENPLDAHVRVQRVDLPALTQIFIRNDSDAPWRRVKVTLNGIYAYEKNELASHDHILLPVNRFAVYEVSGKPTYAPKNVALQTLRIDTDRGSYETELTKK